MRGKRKRDQRRSAPELRARAALLFLDEGKTRTQVAAETGLREFAIREAVAREIGRREAEPTITPEMLSMSAQERLAVAIKQHKRKLDLEFDLRCRETCRQWLNDVSLPQYAKEIIELERSISSRKGIMDRVTYRKILSCLHPDRVQDHALKKRYEEAFRLFTDLEKRVLNEKESPTSFRKMPRTYEELMAMKDKVRADRRAKRTAVNVR